MDHRLSLVEQHAKPKPVTQCVLGMGDSRFELPEVLIDRLDNIQVCRLSSLTNCCTPSLERITITGDVASDFIEEAQGRCCQVSPFAMIGMLLQSLEQIFASAGGDEQASMPISWVRHTLGAS